MNLKFLIFITNKGFVGIDDIVVHDGSCSTTDLCDFETNDMCNYENDPLADFKWERSQGYKFENSTFEIVDVCLTVLFL